MRTRAISNWYLVDLGQHPLEPSTTLQVLWGEIADRKDFIDPDRAENTEWICTSPIYSIDLDKAEAITQNTKYLLNGEGKQITLHFNAIHLLRSGISPELLLADIGNKYKLS